MNLPRSAGVLLHPTSLPGGTLVPEAERFVDWLAEGFQDAIVSQELDPGLFHRYTVDRDQRQRVRIDQFATVLESAIGQPGQALSPSVADAAAPPARPPR